MEIWYYFLLSMYLEDVEPKDNLVLRNASLVLSLPWLISIVSCVKSRITQEMGFLGTSVGTSASWLRWEVSPTVGGAIPWAGILNCTQK